jgi:hypothetical protein
MRRSQREASEVSPNMSGTPPLPKPSVRRLRAYAFDPIISRGIETESINEITIKLPWDSELEPGPVDEYVAVVDYDPATGVFYEPVDLDHVHMLAQDGLPPSENDPRFHQQMVYAVAKTTILHFEQALGRPALWSPHRVEKKGGGVDDEFVRRLLIFPHALREANAYYSPEKKALLFGYFPASDTNPGRNMPGGTVFTCLSHDIVAHETTHALLDGLHRRFIEPSNVDVWALHEAFADIVALFQHFTYSEVLRHQIAETRGDLQKQSLLGELAYQFGQAIGSYGALRDAIGGYDEQGNWKPVDPDPALIHRVTEPHTRGAILVAAVFEAFLTIYQRRVRDLLRIASGGTGILRPGDIHPDLVERLAKEASKTAGHILNICIRALDYCPPVDINFGDYLRALITADNDLVTDDRYNYRLAVIEAFRRRGIYPLDVRTLSEESMLWNRPTPEQQDIFRKVFTDEAKVRELVPDWRRKTRREEIYENAKESQRTLHNWLEELSPDELLKATNITVDKNAPKSIYRKRGSDTPAFEVHSLRPARRIGPDGNTITELVIEMTQRRRGYYSAETQNQVDAGTRDDPPDFIVRGGCTLLVDIETAEVRYCVYKRILSDSRLERMREYLTSEVGTTLYADYGGDPQATFFRRYKALKQYENDQSLVEPFALLHRSYTSGEAPR